MANKTFHRIVLAAALALLVVASSQVHAETITGTFRYADSGGVLRPIAFAKVEIWRFAPRPPFGIWSWGHDYDVSTNGSGSINVPMPFVVSGVVYGLRVFATNYAAVVWPNDVVHTVPFHREPGEPGPVINLAAGSPSSVLNFSYDFTDSWAPQHYNLAETVRRGFDYASLRRDPSESDPIPQANVQPTSVTGSWYNPAADTVVINSSRVFEDYAILHEYAHFLEEQISSFAWIPSTHDGCIALSPLDPFGNVILSQAVIVNSPEHAWMEGFADYFAQAVGLSLPAGTLSGTPGVGTLSTSILESPGTCSGFPDGIPATAFESRVAAALWDIVDQPGDPSSVAEVFDGMARQDVEVFQIFDRELDVYGTWPTITQFYNAWMGRGRNQKQLWAIFHAYGLV